MSEFKEIGEAKYQVTHIFSSLQNKSDIIKNMVLEKFKQVPNLTGNDSPLYNEDGGSIQSEEVL